MSKTIINTDVAMHSKMEDFKNASVEKQRFLAFGDKVPSFNQSSKYETEEKLSYFTEELRARFGTKGFVQRTTKQGFTFNKKTRKLSIWFGTSFNKINGGGLISHILKDCKQEWFTNMSPGLQACLTRALLERIIKGRITNPRDFVKAYLKSSVRIPEISPGVYYDFFKKTDHYSRRSTPGAMNQILRYAKNPDWVLQNYSKIEIDEYMMLDIVKECKILDVKFDWSWSKARINEEHTKMSRQLRALEFEFIENNTIEYFGDPQLPEGWELINNQKRLFMEGSNQDHCVYSYWGNIEQRNYFILSVPQGKGRVTAAINKTPQWSDTNLIEKTPFTMGQCFGLRNDNCSDDLKASIETKDSIKSWIERPETQKFFKEQANITNVYGEKEQKALVEMAEIGI